MADTLDNAAFWLPSHFLTDDDLLSDDHLINKPPTPPHQPGPFSSSRDPFFSTPVKPNNSDDDNDDDDELLAELTRYLTRSSLNHTEKGWGYSTSPQSTLTGFGPWSSSNRSGYSSNGSPTGPSRIPSPPLTTNTKNDAAWELLYEAAAHVARLKQNTTATLGLPRHHLSSLHSQPQARQGSSVWQQGRGERADCYCPNHHHNDHRVHRSYGGGLSSWAPQRATQQNTQVYTQRRTQEMTAVFLGGSGSSRVGVKKQSSGTGVFIPRRADSGTHHSEPEISTRKKSSGCSTVWLPAKVVQALNLNVDEIKNGGVNYNNTPKRVLTDHEIMMARRNALLNMQRRNEMVGGGARAAMVGHHEIGLPTDWTY